MSIKLNCDDCVPAVSCIFEVMPLVGSVRDKLADEWRKRHGSEVTAPLVLLPFEPLQVMLPEQVTTLEFKHGKFMDIIYDATETRDPVIGLSILSDDGLLPVCILAEVIEDELDMRMGYRGFSCMSIGIRAVGPANQVKEVPGSDDLLRTRTAQ